MVVRSLPKEHWGIAVGIINTIWIRTLRWGSHSSGVPLTLAFQGYSGGTPRLRLTRQMRAGIRQIYECDSYLTALRNQFHRTVDFNQGQGTQIN
jgi:hypothetical protein